MINGLEVGKKKKTDITDSGLGSSPCDSWNPRVASLAELQKWNKQFIALEFSVFKIKVKWNWPYLTRNLFVGDFSQLPLTIIFEEGFVSIVVSVA